MRVSRSLPVVTLLAGAGAVFALFYAYPVFRFPRVSGRFPIGTSVRVYRDAGRIEADGQARELVVQFWYPAKPAGSEPLSPYWGGPAPKGMPQLAWVNTLARTNAPLDARQPTYPVLLYSPGWRGNRWENTALVQELASNGFIVACIDHPHSSGLTIYPDGRIVKADPASFLDYSSPEALVKTRASVDREMQLRLSDIQFLATRFESGKHSNDPLLGGRMQLDHMGILGFSFGGSVAAEACLLDHRFRAGINLDGQMLGQSVVSGVPCPFLFLSEDPEIMSGFPLNSPKLPVRLEAKDLHDHFDSIGRSIETYGGYFVALRGASHSDFTDAPLYSPLRRLTGAGRMLRRRPVEIVNQYAAAFFRHTLQGTDEPLVNPGATSAPDVIFHGATPRHAPAI